VTSPDFALSLAVDRHDDPTDHGALADAREAAAETRADQRRDEEWT
jgi:hypothetical protein